jgi:hypothetical protein
MHESERVMQKCGTIQAMDNREQRLNRLKLAQQQFRLACTVHLAVTNSIQTLDVPVERTFGRHRVV